jgi:site-specific recombinase XerD
MVDGVDSESDASRLCAGSSEREQEVANAGRVAQSSHPVVAFSARAASHSDVCQIVARAIKRAGIELASTGSHQLRHALAVDLLRQGLPLADIGQMLRHRSPDATRRYAKVDLDTLREVALPWPGAMP